MDALELASIKEDNEEIMNKKSHNSESDVYIFGLHLDNNTILTISAISFLLFVIAEFIGAFASNSLSLLGDAGAMSIDVFTVSCLFFSFFSYLFI